VKSSYYYFVASLPHLSFSQTKPISYEHFLSLCASFLHANDFDIIKSISLAAAGGKADSLDSMKKWTAWDRALRWELGRLRAAKLDRQIAAHENADNSIASHAAMVAKEIFALSAPLDADEQIDRARWEYVELLEFGRYFDIEWLALYSLKLHILERRETFDQKAGLQRLHAIMEGARNNYDAKGDPVEADLG